MLSGLSSLLFGRGETDDAAVDQTPATCPPTPPLPPPNTQGTTESLDLLDAREVTDSDWVLVDRAGTQDQHPSQPEPGTAEPRGAASPLRHLNLEDGAEEEEQQQSDNPPGAPPARNAVQQRTARRQAAHVFRADPQEDCRQLRLRRCTQRQQYARTAKALSRSRLDLGNKARLVRSCGRKPVSAQRRVLQPSGQMNGRQPQRQY